MSQEVEKKAAPKAQGETERQKTERQKTKPALNSRARHILLAACGLFIRKGFHQTSMRDISTEAGVSLGNLYNHFGGKTDLVARIADLEAEEMAPLIALLDDGAEAGLTVSLEATLEAFLEAFLDWASRWENVALGAEIRAEVYRNPDSGEQYDTVRTSLAKALGTAAARVTKGDPDRVPADKTAADASLPPELILDFLETAAAALAIAPQRDAEQIRTHIRAGFFRLLGLN